jgi:hypothetical protein
MASRLDNMRHYRATGLLLSLDMWHGYRKDHHGQHVDGIERSSDYDWLVHFVETNQRMILYYSTVNGDFSFTLLLIAPRRELLCTRPP